MQQSHLNKIAEAYNKIAEGKEPCPVHEKAEASKVDKKKMHKCTCESFYYKRLQAMNPEMAEMYLEIAEELVDRGYESARLLDNIIESLPKDFTGHEFRSSLAAVNPRLNEAIHTAEKKQARVIAASFVESLKQARKNVGASTCWDGYKAKGTKKKNGRDVPNCVKEGIRDLDPEKGTKERKARLEKKRGMKLDDHPQFKKEAFYFTDEEIADMVEIDEATDEELEEFFIEAIQELAEDEEDLLEICEHLEQVEMLSEEERDAGAMAREKLNKPAGPSRMDRLKSAAKKAGSKLKAGAMKAGAAAKKGIKAAGKSAAANAGKAVGTFQANRIKAKRAELSKKDAPKKEAPKSSSSDDDGTGGKLDALIAKTRGTSGGSSSGGGSSSASSGGGERKGPGLLRRIGSAVKKGLKKAVGKTARAVSGGSDKLAKRLGENYDEIAHLYESGLFSMEEIENVVMELYKGKHGQSEKQYQDGRSDGGKMVSGDSKVSGAAYSSRAVKNTGPNPAGGSKKPQGQGRMTSGARADLQYRKANMKAGK